MLDLGWLSLLLFVVGIEITENWPDLLDVRFKKIFRDQYGQLPSMRQELYQIMRSTKSDERFSSAGSFGTIPEFTGRLAELNRYQGYDVTFTPTQYGGQHVVESRLLLHDQFAVMDNDIRGLAIAAQRTRELHAAAIFNNADNTTTFTGGDALSLVNAAHTSTAVSTTQSNRSTSALTQGSLETARRSMLGFLDDQDQRIPVNPDLLLVPVNLEQTAWELIASKGKVETANNNANFHFGRYKLAVWQYLTDTNNWLLIDSTLMKQFLIWIDLVAPTFERDKDFDTRVAKWSVYMYYSRGFTDWRWVFGNIVA